jgi:tRNA pseudouridine32 synthase/23S rRNA pseudouridine746 synthase
MPARLRLLLSTARAHVVAKPPGLLTVPGLFEPSRASASCLLFAHLRPPRDAFPASPSHLVCHRLDCATSGLLLLAASQAGASALGAAFRAPALGGIAKTYTALVDASQAPEGSPLRAGAAGGELALPLGRREGVPLLHTAAAACGGAARARTLLRPATTRWRLLQWLTPAIARLELTPVTGRTHQLRLHCALGLGAPVVGDALYGFCGGFARDLRLRGRPPPPGSEEALYLAEADARAALPHAFAGAPAPPPRLMLHAQAVELALGALCGEGAPPLGATAHLRSSSSSSSEGDALDDCRGDFEPGGASAGAAFSVTRGAASGAVRLELAAPF